ncbi:MAG: LysM peptidoglycan-binding domain-containing protein, partial [Proteobacteria bacterium]|nr:LysM peptidoglycan-binding domain-containing protein [Pseudomonadota bacterium]
TLALVGLVACGGGQTNQQSAPAEIPSLSTFLDEPETIDLEAAPESIVESIAESMVEPIEIPEMVLDIEEPMVIEAEPAIELAGYSLRRGETLAHFARWSKLPVELIAESSGLDLHGRYEVGTEVLIPIEGEELAVLEQRREEHRVLRVEGYLASRGGSSNTDFYKVRTGDNAWTIARDTQGIPIWVLEAYNPTADLDNLRPGDELMVPVLSDIVVDAD